MEQRAGNGYHLTLSEKLISIIERHVRAAGTEHSIQYSQKFFRRREAARAKLHVAAF